MKAAKMIKGMPHEERLKELDLSSTEKRRLMENSSQYSNI